MPEMDLQYMPRISNFGTSPTEQQIRPHAMMSSATRRLTRTSLHLRSAPICTLAVAASDGDGGSGGDPSATEYIHTVSVDGDIEYFNPGGSTADTSATPFSRVVKAGGMVYGTCLSVLSAKTSGQHCSGAVDNCPPPLCFISPAARADGCSVRSWDWLRP